MFGTVVLVLTCLLGLVVYDLPASFDFLDPWDTPYRYEYDSNKPELYKVWSCGPDKLSTTDDERADDI